MLLEEGYEVVLINSNPATIMTDPEFATATYIEPLIPSAVARVIEKERPDALLPTLGGGTALNLARGLHEDGTLERFGVELIGANYDVDPARRGPRAVQRRRWRGRPARRRARRSSHTIAEAERVLRRHRPAGDHPPRLHDGRRGRRHRAHARPSTASASAEGLAASPDRPGADRRVGDRLGRVRARGDARPQRQRRGRLLDREHRPDGRAHRRLGHRGAAADAHRQAVPGAARPGDRGDPRGRRRDRRLEHPVRGQPARPTRSSSSR